MTVSLLTTLSQPLKGISQYIVCHEQASGLAMSRFIQDTSTGLVPKATFARSKADLAESTFLEVSEAALVYGAPTILGQYFFRNIFTKNADKEVKNLVSKTAVELLGKKNPLSKKLLPIKAAIALGAMAIPLSVFTISYFKNLMTLKIFKQGDFNNVVKLNKELNETPEHQNKVEKNAKRNIIGAATAFAACLAGGILLAKKGQTSKLAQNISELILAPGTKLFKKNKNCANFFNKYFSIDFKNDNGKLVLSKGQLTSCVLIGGLGYFGAAKDRGKQDFLETLSRFPLTGFYAITGSELFEESFKKILLKHGKCKDIIGKKLKVPSLRGIQFYAKLLAKQKAKTCSEIDALTKSEFRRLAKQKALIVGVPFLFSIGVMGFFVAGTTRFFTKYRYNKEAAAKNQT